MLAVDRTSAANVGERNSGVSPGSTTTSPSSTSVVGEPGERDRRGVARAALGRLLDELDVEVGRCVVHERLGHPLRP